MDYIVSRIFDNYNPNHKAMALRAHGPLNGKVEHLSDLVDHQIKAVYVRILLEEKVGFLK